MEETKTELKTLRLRAPKLVELRIRRPDNTAWQCEDCKVYVPEHEIRHIDDQWKCYDCILLGVEAMLP